MTGILLLAVSGVRLVSEDFHEDRMPCSVGRFPLHGSSGEEHGEKDMHDAKMG